MSRFALLCCVIFLCSCTTPSGRIVNGEDGVDRRTICEIRRAPAIYLNKVVRVSGSYHSDGITYSFIKDDLCGVENNSIQLGPFGNSTGDATVLSLVKRLRSQCTIVSGCDGEIKLDVMGTIKKDDDGFLQIEFLHIY